MVDAVYMFARCAYTMVEKHDWRLPAIKRPATKWTFHIKQFVMSTTLSMFTNISSWNGTLFIYSYVQFIHTYRKNSTQILCDHFQFHGHVALETQLATSPASCRTSLKAQLHGDGRSLQWQQTENATTSTTHALHSHNTV